jgi:hypothetical protein
MQIVDIFFSDLNYLHIPLSVNDPNGSVTPNNTKDKWFMCKIRAWNSNALGLSLYNEVKALTEVTINEPANLKV